MKFADLVYCNLYETLECLLPIFEIKLVNHLVWLHFHDVGPRQELDNFGVWNSRTYPSTASILITHQLRSCVSHT